MGRGQIENDGKGFRRHAFGVCRIESTRARKALLVSDLAKARLLNSKNRTWPTISENCFDVGIHTRPSPPIPSIIAISKLTLHTQRNPRQHARHAYPRICTSRY